MSSKLNRYKSVDYNLPDTYLSWDLFGAGIDNLGRGGKPVELPLREPNADEVLLRVDALGLCFSDTKLIWAGPEHARIRGRDLEADPTVPGHEAALTVVKVGSDWKSKFNIGDRFIIQADIFINGEQKAFGYVQRGAMAQYTYAGPMVLDGDDGCYLLPLKDTTGYAEAALVEPWACVEGAYNIPYRSAPKDGGRLLLVWAEENEVDFSGAYTDGAPAVAVSLGKTGCDLTPVLGDSGLVSKIDIDPVKIAEISDSETGDKGFDDIIIIGKASAELVAACDAVLGEGGIMAFISDQPMDKAAIDIGRVHYKNTRHVGTKTSKVIDAYTANLRNELQSGGSAWMVGGAGPMGQMHVQRALEIDNPPTNLYVTDLSDERLKYVADRLEALAKKNGVNMICCDVSDRRDLTEEIMDLTGGKGFDDVYVHAPVAPLVEQAAGFLAENPVLNIFAGVGLGTMASLSPDIFTEKHARMIGSSGSSMQAITSVLNKMEDGKLATRMSLAALGGIGATWEGIKGVKENRFPGKTVIYPHVGEIPLMTPGELSGTCAASAGALEPGDVWTNASEEALLEDKLEI